MQLRGCLLDRSCVEIPNGLLLPQDTQWSKLLDLQASTVIKLVLIIENSVAKVTADLNKHYRFLHPIVALFLPSYHQIRQRFQIARRLLEPLITERRVATKDQYLDMVQWLIHSAKGRDAELDKLVTRILFLNAAAIHTTAETVTNVLLDLCARPKDMAILRNELLYALQAHDGINLTTLSSLKKMDSFMKESHRLNSLGLSKKGFMPYYPDIIC